MKVTYIHHWSLRPFSQGLTSLKLCVSVLSRRGLVGSVLAYWT